MLKCTEKLETVWNFVTYDVWGNARDGWEVNNAFSVSQVRIPAEQHVCNEYVPGSTFLSAHVTDREILKALGLVGSGISSTSEGDDLNVYLEEKNGKPFGELRCVSHDSLSPVRHLRDEHGNLVE